CRLRDSGAPELLLVPSFRGPGTREATQRAGAGSRCVRAVVRHALPGRRAETVLRSTMSGLRLLANNGNTALSRLLDTLGVVFTAQSLAQALAAGQRRLDLSDTVVLSSEELTRGVREHSADTMAGFLRRHRSVLLYPFQSTADALAAVRQCIGVNAEATSPGM